MEEIIEFLKEYIDMEYETAIACYSERNQDKYFESANKIYYHKSFFVDVMDHDRIRHSHNEQMLDEWIEKSKAKLKTIIKRPIYFIKWYRHCELGDIFACYAGQPYANMTKKTICLYVARVWDKLKVVAENYIVDSGIKWEESCHKGLNIPLLELTDLVSVYCILEPPEEFLKKEYMAYSNNFKTQAQLIPKGIFDNDYGFQAGKYFCRIFRYGDYVEMLCNFIDDIDYEDNAEYQYFNLADEIYEAIKEAFNDEADLSSWLLARLWYLTNGAIQQVIWGNDGMSASDGGEYDTLLLIEDIEKKEGLGILAISGTPSWSNISLEYKSKRLDWEDFFRELSESLLCDLSKLARCKLIVQDFENDMYPFEYGWDGEKFLGKDNSKI